MKTRSVIALTTVMLLGLYGFSLWYKLPGALTARVAHLDWAAMAHNSLSFLAQHAADWLSLGVGTLACLTLGRGVANAARLGPQPICILFIGGSLAWGFVALALGSTGLLYAPVLNVMGGIAAIVQLWQWRAVKWVRPKPRDLILPLGAVLVLGPVAIALMHPTTFYDALVYHLSLPKLYTASHSTAPLPWNMYSNFPVLGEMQLTFAWCLGGQITAQLWSLACLVAAVSSLGAAAKTIGGERTKIYAQVMALCTPALSITALMCGVDIFAFAFASASLVFLASWLCDSNANAGAAARGAMLFASGAAACKWPSALYVLAPTALLLGVGCIQKKLTLRELFSAATTGAVVLMPGLARTTWATGNPFFPLPTFGGGLPPQVFQALQHDAHVPDLASPAALLATPWEMIFGAPSALEAQFGTAAFVGVLPAFAIAALVLTPNKKVVRHLTAFALAALLAWSTTFHMTRFVLGALGLCLVLAAYALAELSQQSRAAQGLLIATLAVHAAVNISVITFASLSMTRGFAQLSGGLDADTYLRVRASDRAIEMGAWPLVQKAGLVTDDASRFLTVGEPASLYLPGDAIAATGVDTNPLVAMLGQGTPQQVLQRLRDLGVTHVLYRPEEFRRLLKFFDQPVAPDWQPRIDGFLQQLGDPIASSTLGRIYAVRN